jgi:hypothetical protein
MSLTASTGLVGGMSSIKDKFQQYIKYKVDRVPPELASQVGWEPMTIEGKHLQKPISNMPWGAFGLWDLDRGVRKGKVGQIDVFRIVNTGSRSLIYEPSIQSTFEVASSDLTSAQSDGFYFSEFFNPLGIPQFDIQIVITELQKAGEKEERIARAIYYTTMLFVRQYIEEKNASFKKKIDQGQGLPVVIPQDDIKGIWRTKFSKTLNALPNDWVNFDAGAYHLSDKAVVYVIRDDSGVIRAYKNEFLGGDTVTIESELKNGFIWLPLHLPILKQNPAWDGAQHMMSVYGSNLAMSCTKLNVFRATNVVVGIGNWVSIFSYFLENKTLKDRVTLDWRRHAKSADSKQVPVLLHSIMLAIQHAARLEGSLQTGPVDKKICKTVFGMAVKQDVAAINKLTANERIVEEFTKVDDFVNLMKALMQDVTKFRGLLRKVGYTVEVNAPADKPIGYIIFTRQGEDEGKSEVPDIGDMKALQMLQISTLKTPDESKVDAYSSNLTLGQLYRYKPSATGAWQRELKYKEEENRLLRIPPQHATCHSTMTQFYTSWRNLFFQPPSLLYEKAIQPSLLRDLERYHTRYRGAFKIADFPTLVRATHRDAKITVKIHTPRSGEAAITTEAKVLFYMPGTEWIFVTTEEKKETISTEILQNKALFPFADVYASRNYPLIRLTSLRDITELKQDTLDNPIRTVDEIIIPTACSLLDHDKGNWPGLLNMFYQDWDHCHEVLEVAKKRDVAMCDIKCEPHDLYIEFKESTPCLNSILQKAFQDMTKKYSQELPSALMSLYLTYLWCLYLSKHPWTPIPEIIKPASTPIPQILKAASSIKRTATKHAKTKISGRSKRKF